MPTLKTRRTTLGIIAASAALPTVAGCATSRATRSRTIPHTEDVRVGVVGVRGRGNGLAQSFQNTDGVEVVAMCDVDAEILSSRCDSFEEKFGHRPRGYRDVRRMLDCDDLHAVVIATPNHWHALMTVWACQAGKDVYVEKPVCHDLREGRVMADTARRTGRVVATGTQSRSYGGIRKGIEHLRAGELGAPIVAHGTCWKPRRSIGRVDGPQAVPSHIDYDLWTGPAPMRPLRRKNLHYDWHWDHNTGNGDLGNQGIHQIDLCRWMLGEETLAPRVVSFGGRVGYLDDGNTPNTQVVIYEYASAPMIFTVRGLPRDRAQRDGDWSMDRTLGGGITASITCEGGTLVTHHGGTTATMHDRDGTEIRRFEGGGNHIGNFIEAVRAGDSSTLYADVEEGRLSSTMCHQGMASHLLGRPATGNEVLDAAGDSEHVRAAVEAMLAHLRANEIDLDRSVLVAGDVLELDVVTETHPGRPDVDALLAQPGRAGFRM